MTDERLFKIINPDRPYNENDLRFQEMMYMINKSGVPKNQIGKKLIPDDVDYEAFLTLHNIQENILDFVESGESIYLFSNICGNGKTTWSIKLLLQYFNEVWACNCYKERGLFINVPTFLTKLKTTISIQDPEFDELKLKLPEVDLVVWDDIAATKLSDFDYNNLLTYIDKRTVEGKSNIYTGNIYPNKLNEYLGDRLASRVLSGSNKIELRGQDKR